MSGAMQREWVTEGFEAFRAGTFGSGGQNLYVSRAGVLQRIHQFDVDGDGHLDLLFCNSQDHWERPPAYVFDGRDGYARAELPAEGGMGGVIADLNGDGTDDLVVANHYNGMNSSGVNSTIYYGSPAGWSLRRQQMLPTPFALSVAAGDFDGDGRLDLAFACTTEQGAGHVRVFGQTELGFEPKRFADTGIRAVQLCAADLDGDGCDDLVVLDGGGRAAIHWGGTGGLSCGERTEIPGEAGGAGWEEAARGEYVRDAPPGVRVMALPERHVAVPNAAGVRLISLRGRRAEERALLPCAGAQAAAAGDLDGDGAVDVVVACKGEEQDASLVFWGRPGGGFEPEPAVLASSGACDAAIADLDGDGRAEVVLCQHKSAASFTTESLVYPCGPGRRFGPVRRLVSHDARRALTGRPDGGDPRLVLINHFARTSRDDVPIYVYRGGDGGYAPERRLEVVASGAVDAVSCDLCDRGTADLVICNASEYSKANDDAGSFILRRGPRGFAAEPDVRLATAHAHGMVCADLNRDGYLDLVFGGFGEPDLLFFHGGPDGFDAANPRRLRMELDGVLYDDPRFLCAADLDGDGWLDIVVPQISADRSFILWGGPEGYSMERCRPLSVFHAVAARAADLDGDGRLDLVVAGHTQSETGPDDAFLYVYWNGPDGLREDRRTLLPARAGNSVSIADFDNDGLLDIFVSSYTTPRERDLDSYIYWNRPGRGFDPDDRTRLFTHSASGSLAADLNGNGWTDLVVANHKVWGDHRGYSEIWWNGPDGFDRRRTTRLPTMGPHGMRSVEPGNLHDRGPEEFYTSPVRRLADGARVIDLRWEAEVPADTWIRGRVRAGADEAAVRSAAWSPWAGRGERLAATGGPCVDGGPCVQYQLALGAVLGKTTPRVRRVTLRYDDDV